MKAMILAAGRGTRMGSLSNKTPKPLLRIKDKAGKVVLKIYLLNWEYGFL